MRFRLLTEELMNRNYRELIEAEVRVKIVFAYNTAR
jgi:hypothetical protein